MSKVRVILKYNNDPPSINRNAYALVDAFFGDYGAPVKPPLAYAKWPRWKKAQWKASNMTFPGQLVFKVFREPRNTRAGRSLFYSEVLKLGGVVPEKKKQIRMRNGNRIDFMNEAEAPVWQAGILREPVPARLRDAQAAGRIRVVRNQVPEVGGH